MDNGRGQQKISAKEFTAQIEQGANDLVASEGTISTEVLNRDRAQQIGQMAAGAEGFVVNNTHTDVERAGVARERAQQMGWQVLDGGQGPVVETTGMGQFSEKASGPEIELTQVENEVEQPLEFVGNETPFQVEQREQDDLEDLQDEEGKGEIDFVDKIVATNQEAIAQAIAPQVNKIINQKSFRPAELVRLCMGGMYKMLSVFNRKFKERN